MGDRLVGFFFRNKTVEVTEAVWIQQAQASKVTFLAELFRGGG